MPINAGKYDGAKSGGLGSEEAFKCGVGKAPNRGEAVIAKFLFDARGRSTATDCQANRLVRGTQEQVPSTLIGDW